MQTPSHESCGLCIGELMLWLAVCELLMDSL
jgi:hypothetical protein